MKKLNINKKYKKINYNNKYIKRPLDMRMNVKKFEKKFKIKLPNIYSEANKLIKEYKS